MKQLSLLIAFVSLGIFASAQKASIYSGKDGAINGYDAVAYFTEGKPVKGTDAYVYQWQGASWHFANKANRDAFAANPEKYAPKYGGYCAYGTADGHKAPTSPDAWTVVDGKLYLNYNKDVKGMWDKDRPGFIKKADENWPKIKDKE